MPSFTNSQDPNNPIFVTRNNKLWTNHDLDLATGHSYNIDRVPVITATGLGATVMTSNLTQIGTLQKLAVSGDAELGDFAYFNTAYNRLGIGTDSPIASLNIVDNNVDIVIGSPEANVAFIGTASHHDIVIGTDNLSRITVKNSGEVNIGDPVHGGGVLNVYGTLYATTVQSDNRIDRSQPLQFSASESGIYGLGLVWSGSGYTRQLVMLNSPDRLWTSESFDISENQSYMINGKSVLSENALGASVTKSNINVLGALQSLFVTGPAQFIGGVDASQSDVKARSVFLNDGTNSISIESDNINSSSKVSITLQKNNVISSDVSHIEIGDKLIQTKPVKVFGPLSININNPDPSLQFSVSGDVSIGGKRLTSAAAHPTYGNYSAGDICWNSNPGPNSYIGWVCVVTGTPGQWLGFGMIANQ